MQNDSDVQDGGVPPLSSTSSLVVRVRDVDDLPPRFSSSVYRASIQESLPGAGPPHAPLLFKPEIHAADQDTQLRAPLQYSITAGNDMQYFRVDPDTAEIFLTKTLDLETLDGDKFSLELTARQKNSELKTATASLEIEVIDVNDNKPEFEVEQYNMTVIENLPVGFRIMQFTALDRDRGENAKFHYILEDPSKAFGLEADGSLVLSRPELFDRERMERVVVRVVAIEDTPSVLEDDTPSSVKVEIHLLDTNDNSPVFIPSECTCIFELCVCHYLSGCTSPPLPGGVDHLKKGGVHHLRGRKHACNPSSLLPYQILPRGCVLLYNYPVDEPHL